MNGELKSSKVCIGDYFVQESENDVEFGHMVSDKRLKSKLKFKKLNIGIHSFDMNSSDLVQGPRKQLGTIHVGELNLQNTKIQQDIDGNLTIS